MLKIVKISFQKDADFFKQELFTLGELPISKQEILFRVFSGEDVRVVDLNRMRDNYSAIQKAFPKAEVFVAIKAIGEKGMGETLAQSFKDVKFEIATIGEFHNLIAYGVDPKNIMFSHPDKDVLEVKQAYLGGVRRFVTDSEGDLTRIADHAPGSELLIRVRTQNNADFDNFNDRFGVQFGEAERLIQLAKDKGLKPKGIAFHVGEQRNHPTEWDANIKEAASFFNQMEKQGFSLSLLDIGAVFPCATKKAFLTSNIMEISFKKSINKHFGKKQPQLIIEPGRFIGASAGVTFARVINVKPGTKEDQILTLSIGRYSSGIMGDGYGYTFYKVENEVSEVKYSVIKGMDTQEVTKPIKGSYVCRSRGGATASVAMYGKACASIDNLHDVSLRIPKSVSSGDLVVVTGTGAYGNIASQNWCGRPSPTSIIFDSKTGKIFQKQNPPCL